MVTKDSSLFTNQASRNTLLHTDPTTPGGALRMVRLPYTCDGTEATNDKLRLGYPRIKGTILPHLSRIINVGSGDTDADFILKKVDADGTETAICGSTAVDNDSVPLAVLSGNAQIDIGEDDYIEAVPTVTAMTAAEVLYFDIAIYSPYTE